MIKTSTVFLRRSPQGTVRSGTVSRVLDFHLGRMLLWIIGLIGRRSRHPVAQPVNIGLCIFGAIGDTVLCSAILADLRRYYPSARIVIVVSKTNHGAIQLLKDHSESLVLPIYRPKEAIALMRRQHFDLLIDANQWLRISAVYCALAGAKYTVGFRTRGQFRHYAFDCVAEHGPARHEVENYRALLAAIGVVGKCSPTVHTSVQDLAIVQGVLKPPYVVLHPWAGGSNAVLKEWPAQNWIEVGRMLAAQGYTLVVSGAPVDSHNTKTLIDQAHRLGVPIITMAGRLTLGQTACMLQSAALVVSVNTGVMHMAAALGRPLVALHGPTNPRRWGPLGDSAVSIVPVDVPTGIPVGYLNLGFEFPRDVSDCMKFISVEAVLAAVASVMDPKQAIHKQSIAFVSGNSDQGVDRTEIPEKAAPPGI